MQIDDAVALIRSAVEGHDGTWVDMGAGRGTFTRALATVLGRESRVFALDRDSPSLAEIEQWARAEQRAVVPIEADFTKDFALPVTEPVAGMLFANSLHFVKEPGALLARLVKMLGPDGRVVLVEYDRRAASRWVPYPIAIAGLGGLSEAAGLSKFRVVESRPSNYEGIIYCAVATQV